MNKKNIIFPIVSGVFISVIMAFFYILYEKTSYEEAITTSSVLGIIFIFSYLTSIVFSNRKNINNYILNNYLFSIFGIFLGGLLMSGHLFLDSHILLFSGIITEIVALFYLFFTMNLQSKQITK